MQWNSGIWWWGVVFTIGYKIGSGHSGHSGCSRHCEIVVYGSADIVFGAKRSNQWMQWMWWMQSNSSKCSHHHIPLFHCVHCIHWFDLFHQRQCSLHHIPLFDYVHCIHCIHWFGLFAPKTMSPPPYSTIPLCPLHLLCPLHPLESPLCNSYTTWYLCFFLHNLIVLLMAKSADMGYLSHYTEIEVYT